MVVIIIFVVIIISILIYNHFKKKPSEDTSSEPAENYHLTAYEEYEVSSEIAFDHICYESFKESIEVEVKPYMSKIIHFYMHSLKANYNEVFIQNLALKLEEYFQDNLSFDQEYLVIIFSGYYHDYKSNEVLFNLYNHDLENKLRNFFQKSLSIPNADFANFSPIYSEKDFAFYTVVLYYILKIYHTLDNLALKEYLKHRDESNYKTSPSFKMLKANYEAYLKTRKLTLSDYLL